MRIIISLVCYFTVFYTTALAYQRQICALGGDCEWVNEDDLQEAPVVEERVNNDWSHIQNDIDNSIENPDAAATFVRKEELNAGFLKYY